MPVLMLFAGYGCKPEQPENKDWEYIRYDKHPILEWSDFKSPVDIFSPYDAAASSGTHFDYTYVDGRIEFEAYTIFERYGSWSRVKSDADELLQHEQLHFDISELHTRMLKKELSEYFFTDQYEQEINDIYYRNRYEKDVMQDLYDTETNHSTIRAEQERWNVYVKKRLTELEAYKDPIVVSEISH
jgi:hypothetical protein